MHLSYIFLAYLIEQAILYYPISIDFTIGSILYVYVYMKLRYQKAKKTDFRNSGGMRHQVRHGLKSQIYMYLLFQKRKKGSSKELLRA